MSQYLIEQIRGKSNVQVYGRSESHMRAETLGLMLQQLVPTDYVIATGETHSVRELCEIAFARVGLDWKEHVEIDPALVRPAEVDMLVGDASKAEREIGWKPVVTFEQMMAMMVDADLARLSATARV